MVVQSTLDRWYVDQQLTSQSETQCSAVNHVPFLFYLGVVLRTNLIELRSPMGRDVRGVNPPIRNKNRKQQTGLSLFPVVPFEPEGKQQYEPYNIPVRPARSLLQAEHAMEKNPANSESITTGQALAIAPLALTPHENRKSHTEFRFSIAQF